MRAGRALDIILPAAYRSAGRWTPGHPSERPSHCGGALPGRRGLPAVWGTAGLPGDGGAARPGCGVRAAPRQRGTRARDAGRGGRHSRSTASRPRRFIRPARRDVGVQPGADRLSGREDLLRGVRAAAGGAQEPREGRTGRAGAARPPLRRGAACEGARVGRRRGGT